MIDIFKKGDIITYSNGLVKYINKSDKYNFYFDNEYYNSKYDLQIVKIQRYVKFLCFYKLKTIYEKGI